MWRHFLAPRRVLGVYISIHLAINSYSIRTVAVGGLELFQEISRNTFRETFADSNTEKNMALYMEQSLSLEKLKTELLDPHSNFFSAG